MENGKKVVKAVRAKPVEPVETLEPNEPNKSNEPKEPESPGAKIQSNYKTIILTAIIAALVVIIALLLWNRGNQTTTDQETTVSSSLSVSSSTSVTETTNTTETSTSSTTSQTIVAPDILNVYAPDAKRILEERGFTISRVSVAETPDSSKWCIVKDTSVEPSKSYDRGTGVELVVWDKVDSYWDYYYGPQDSNYPNEKRNTFYRVNVGSGNTLNLRNYPETDSISNGQIENGTVLLITDTGGNWGFTKYKNNYGWVCIYNPDTGKRYLVED